MAIIIPFTPYRWLGVPFSWVAIYRGLGLLILFLTIISTIFACSLDTRVGPSTTLPIKGFTPFIAISLRRIALLFAFTNATGLIVMS